MKKQNIMPVLVLTAICVVVAALLGGVHMLTKDRIAENALIKEQQSLLEVFPGATLFDPEPVAIPEGAPKTIKTIYRESSGLGYVFIVIAPKTDYSSGDMTVSVGVSGGAVVGAKLTSYNESKDFGKTTYPEKFVGKTEADYDGVEVTSGVTFSSKAFKSAIGDALATDKLLSEASALVPVSAAALATPLSADAGAELPKTDSEIRSLMAELVPGAEFTESALPSGAPEALKKLYSVSLGGYVAYIVVPGAYVPVATEALVYIDDGGDIANIDLLQWVVGHGVEAGDFADRFIGKDAYHIADVEIVSGATGTSVDFKTAAELALNAVTDLMNIRDEVWLEFIDEMIPNSAKIERLPIPEGAPETLVGLYSDTAGRGTVAHIVVAGAYVPVATEALVYFNQWGEIRDVKLMQWVVGHGVEPGDFAERFVGMTKETVESVELVTAATGTSADFKSALIDAFPYIPTEFPVLRIVAAAVLVAIIGGFVAVLVISRKRRAAK